MYWPTYVYMTLPLVQFVHKIYMGAHAKSSPIKKVVTT